MFTYIRAAVSKRFLQSLSILFVTLLLLQSVVSIFVYDSQLKSIRRKFKWEKLFSLKNEQLTLVKVAKSLEEKPNQQFTRIHGREFRFLGEMYDIVRKTAHTDTTYYYCFHDGDESEVVRSINQWMHDNFGDNNNSKDKSKPIKDAFKQPYISNKSTFTFIPEVRFIKIVHAPQLYTSVSSGNVAPPPELV